MKRIFVILIIVLFLVAFVGCNSNKGYYCAKYGNSRPLPFLIHYNGVDIDKLWYYDFSDDTVKNGDYGIRFSDNKSNCLETRYYSIAYPVNIFDTFVELDSFSDPSLHSFVFNKIDSDESFKPEDYFSDFKVNKMAIMDIIDYINTEESTIDNNSKLTTVQKKERIDALHKRLSEELDGIIIRFDGIIFDVALVGSYSYKDFYKIRLLPVKNNKKRNALFIYCPKDMTDYELNKGLIVRVTALIEYNKYVSSWTFNEPKLGLSVYQLTKITNADDAINK